MTNTLITITNAGLVTINVVVGSAASTPTAAPIASSDPLAPSSDYWDMAIMFVSPVVVWAIGHYFPKLPKVCLPLLTPVIGILAGIGVNIATDAHMGWWTMAKAGMLAVFVREVTNQTVTKGLQNRSSKPDDAPPAAPNPPPAVPVPHATNP